RGWATYHSPVVAKAAYSRMEYLLYWRLWKWAERRHPRKSAEWVKRRYWMRPGGGTETFAASVLHEDGTRRLVSLYSLISTPIERHRKIKGTYNPFDPADEQYGEKLRQARQMNRL